MRNFLFLATLLAAFAIALPAQTKPSAKPPTVAEAQAFIDTANADLLKLTNEDQQAHWVEETYITDDTESLAAQADTRLLARTNELVIAARRFDGLQMPPSLAREFLLLKLNGSPTDPKLLEEMSLLGAQLDGMYGKGKYCPPGKPCVGVDTVQVTMQESRDPQELLDTWVGWHKIAVPMRAIYPRFMELQNEGAREFGYKDEGQLWRAGYDMTPQQFSEEVDRVYQQLQPFYKELHAYVRSRLIAKYGDVARRPDGMIPAHLLGNMWAQEWDNIADIVTPSDTQQPYDIGQLLVARHTDALGMVHYGENFYKSIGFPALPDTFWQRSQFTKPRDRDVVCHASAWDVDSDRDVRVKVCLFPNDTDFTTVHHELGHNYYQMAYRNQPFLFRNGANDGFHEAIGDSIALSITPTYLKQLGFINQMPPESADIPLLLRQAMKKVAFLPFGLLIDKWRWQVFDGTIKPADYNKSWWALREQYQGVAPPVDRTENDFDPGAKFHIADNVPYMRYFLARIYQFQFYRAMCRASGYTGPLYRCSVYGSKEAGDKLATMLAAGQSQPWQLTLKQMTGEDHLDASAMIEYFQPLTTWLHEQNVKNGVTPGWTVAADPLKAK